MKFCMSTGVGTWTNWLTFEPDLIIVRMPKPENLKVEDLSKLVKQASHSEHAKGHGMHCREILFTPHCSPRAREFLRLRLTFLYDVQLCSYGTSNLPNFRILAFVGGTCTPPSALLVENVTDILKLIMWKSLNETLYVYETLYVIWYSVQSVRSKEEKEVLDHFAGVVIVLFHCHLATSYW